MRDTTMRTRSSGAYDKKTAERKALRKRNQVKRLARSAMEEVMENRNGETIAAYGCKCGIGEHSAKYWESLDNEKVQVTASGGTWTIGTRAEQTHIPAAMIKLLEVALVLSRLHWCNR
jgi:hypothetical protein